MKAKLVFAALLLGSIALAKDPVSLARNWKAGDKDVYAMKIKLNSQMGEITIEGTSTQVVKKVYDNGDADIETTNSEMKFHGMGMDRDLPAGPASTMRLSKFGMPVGLKADGQKNPRGMNLSFMRYALATGENLEVGKAVAIDKTDAENPKNKVKGTYTLVSTDNSIYKITSSMDVSTEETGDTPMHIDATSLVAAGGKLNRTDAKITHLPATGGMQLDSVEMTMERKG